MITSHHISLTSHLAFYPHRTDQWIDQSEFMNVADMVHCCYHCVKNGTMQQLPLMASRPPLGCRTFIECTNLCYAFWVTMHL